MEDVANVEIAIKICGTCKRELPLTEFYKDCGKKDGLRTYCKPCENARVAAWQRKNPEKVKQAWAAWEARNPGQNRRDVLKKYGLTLKQYEQQLADQGGKCAICREEYDVLCVDHDHETGVNRGLLCRNCNSGIGKLRDSVEMLHRSIAYLESYGLAS
jgi:uncharacterized CHY-type Zn-finger protein